MTEKERMVRAVGALNGKSLIKLALHLGVLSMVDLELDVRNCSANDIKQALKDIGAIKG